MSRPVVCQVLHGLEVGGVEIHASRLARGLSSRYRFVFACLDGTGPLADELRGRGFTVHALGRRPGVDLSCGRRLAALLDREGADLVHAHTWSPFFYAAAARRWRPAPPLLYAEHSRPHPDRRRRRHVLFNRLALRPGDRVVSVSAWAATQVCRNKGIARHRIETVPNGVALPAPDPRARAEVRRELEVPGRGALLLQVGRLDGLKDPETALAALGVLLRKGLDATLVLAGDGPEREAVERLVWGLGLVPHVRLLGLRRDVPRLLAAADVCVLSSRSEAAPLALLEAMAASLPVVASDVGGVAEIVREGVTGWLVPAGDVTALAQRLSHLLRDREAARRMGAAGHRIWRDCFAEPAMLARYQRIYEEMIDRSHGLE